jgi:hypothetical protein
MIRHAIFYACVAPLLLLSFVPRSQAQQHDREYWRGIVQHKYSIPENESADALARELSTLLGSPDPELRDDLAYSILGTLADSPMLTKEEAASTLRAIAARLSTAPEVYTQGEQDRLAAAVVSVIRRNDFDVAAFEPWLAALQNEDRDVWTKTSVASLARYQNHNYLLQALTVRLSLEPASPRSEQYRTEVLKVLADR